MPWLPLQFGPNWAERAEMELWGGGQGGGEGEGSAWGTGSVDPSGRSPRLLSYTMGERGEGVRIHNGRGAGGGGEEET
jgi:hypothetical protein